MPIHPIDSGIINSQASCLQPITDGVSVAAKTAAAATGAQFGLIWLWGMR